MKRIITLLALFCGIFLLFGCSSQTSSDSNSLSQELVGKWENNSNVNEDNKDTSGSGAFNESSKTVYEFNEDGTFNVSSDTDINYDDGNQDTSSIESSGTYTLDGDQLTMTMDTIDGKSEQETIQEIQNANPSIEIDQNSIPAFQPNTVTIKIDGDTLSIETPGVSTVEYTRVKE